MTINLKKAIKKLFKKITKNKAVISFLSGLIYWYVKLIGHTTKWESKGFKMVHNNWDNKQNMILVGWHGRVLMFPFFWNCKRQTLYAIVSKHQDGRLIAGVLDRFKISTVDGSSNNNAKGAALGLMRALKQGDSICIVPDGPRGPRMRMNMSPIYYAQKTGLPIYGVHFSAAKSYIMEKAWDKMMLPLPFSKGIISVSEPIYVPENATGEELEAYRLQLEDSLNKLSIKNDKKMNIKPIEPGHISALKHGQIKEE